MMLSTTLRSLLVGSLTLSVSNAWAINRCPSVLYSLANDPQGASIVSMCVGFDGTISGSSLTSTGGKGLAGVTGPGQPAVGSLFSSDSVTVVDNVSTQMVCSLISPVTHGL